MKKTWGRHGRITIEDARAALLEKTKPGDNGCLIWTGAIGSHKRYGICGVAGRSMLAHRAAWLLFKGKDPGKAKVCHRCDNGLCVNVEHLFIGTQRDNVHDMEAKNRSRHPSGESHGRAKLTQDDANTIRRLHSEGVATRAIARLYPFVSRNSVRRITRGEGWITK